jgi:cell division protein FtsB
MAKFKRVKSTIPGRTWSGRKVQVSNHAIYLKLSFLSQERRRRQVEMDNLKARLELLQKRMTAIDQEIAKHSASIVPISQSHIAEADPKPLPSGISIKY